MKTNNEQEQMIEKEFNSEWEIEATKWSFPLGDHHKKLVKEAAFRLYKAGRLKSMEEINNYKKAWQDYYAKAWQNYYAKAQVLNNRVDELESSLPDQAKLREAIKSINSLASWDQEDYNLEEILKLKTFLESLGEK